MHSFQRHSGNVSGPRVPRPRGGRVHERLTAGLLAGVLGLALGPSGCTAELDAETPADIARRAVAAELGVEIGSTRIVRVESRQFPDASLGCPAPGMLYAQVITPGNQVIVEADGRRFDVRVAGATGRICRLAKEPAPRTDAVPQPARELGEAARQDLALRLRIPVEDIVVTNLRRLIPGESLPGCGVVCTAEETAACGIGVRLRAAERDFEYVALPAGVRPCPELADR